MSSLYAKLIAVIEQKITPMAGAIGQQKYVTSIRDDPSEQSLSGGVFALNPGVQGLPEPRFIV